MLGMDQGQLQFIIQVQDCAKKYRYTKLILGVPKAVTKNQYNMVSLPGMPSTETHIGQDAYKRWVENIKIS